MDKTIVIDTPEGIEHWRVSSAISMLWLEVRTGMGHSRGSVLKACERNWGCPKRTKKGALEWMLAFYERQYGMPYKLPE